MSDLLQVTSVSKHFGGIKALTDVSFTVRKGEIFGVIGRMARVKPRCSMR